MSEVSQLFSILKISCCDTKTKFVQTASKLIVLTAQYISINNLHSQAQSIVTKCLLKRSNNADITWALKLKFIDCKLDFISLILDILKNF